MKRTIRIARIEKNLNQKELCRMIGIGVNTLVKIEKGDYSSLRYPIMIKLSKALGKTPQELFFED